MRKEKKKRTRERESCNRKSKKEIDEEKRK